MTEKTWERLEPTFSLEDERLTSLKRIVPEAFTDGMVDFEQLRAMLGEAVEDESAEHFGLNWTGKREARRLAGMPSKGTLVPVPGKGLNEDTTENIFIEGDNLEVLKLLHKSYRGKIKMIYIDPPYNTGNDFIYKDDYRMPLESYLQRSGQKSDMGELLTSNPKSSGRFHSDWLNMMYPRLRVAKDLLREDGVIFVSIDNNEVHNLRQMMNEIFGEENFVEQITWKNKYGAGAKTKGFIEVHEYLLCFAKTSISNFETPLSEDEIAKYKNKDSKFAVRGGFVTQPLATTSLGERENLVYPIPFNGKEILPSKQWVWAKERTMKALENDELVIKETDGKFSVRFKQYLKDENGVLRKGKPVSVLNGPFTQEGTREIEELFGRPVFDFPKPSSLLKYLYSAVINENASKDGIFLDFFAGSGTTAHAILHLNAEDGGNRKFISVQIGEHIDSKHEGSKFGFKTIAELTAERIRRVSANLSDARDARLPMDEATDIGFKVFSLDNSSFKAWSDYEGNDLDELRGLLQKQIDSTFVEGAREDAILTEIILLEGFPLTSKIEIDETFQKNTVRRITHEWCEHRLFVTLDKEIQEETIRMAEDLEKIDIFICLDNALTDQDKLRLADVCRLKTL
jgi:adenine-specific DNA-methyltransferase